MVLLVRDFELLFVVSAVKSLSLFLFILYGRLFVVSIVNMHTKATKAELLYDWPRRLIITTLQSEGICNLDVMDFIHRSDHLSSMYKCIYVCSMFSLLTCCCRTVLIKKMNAKQRKKRRKNAKFNLICKSGQ